MRELHSCVDTVIEMEEFNTLCGDEFESVIHVLWEYNTFRDKSGTAQTIVRY